MNGIKFHNISPFYLKCCNRCGSAIGGSKVALKQHVDWHNYQEPPPLDPETEEIANWKTGGDNYGSLD